MRIRDVVRARHPRILHRRQIKQRLIRSDRVERDRQRAVGADIACHIGCDSVQRVHAVATNRRVVGSPKPVVVREHGVRERVVREHDRCVGLGRSDEVPVRDIRVVVGLRHARVLHRRQVDRRRARGDRVDRHGDRARRGADQARAAVLARVDLVDAVGERLEDPDQRAAERVRVSAADLHARLEQERPKVRQAENLERRQRDVRDVVGVGAA